MPSVHIGVIPPLGVGGASLDHSQPLPRGSATTPVDTTLSLGFLRSLPAHDEALAKLFFSQRTWEISADGQEELVQLGLSSCHRSTSCA